MQMPNDEFSIEELVCNESFQRYCLGSDLETQVLWNEWISGRPQKASDFEEAKKIVELLTAKQGSRIRQLKDLRIGIKQREAFGSLLSSVPDTRKTVPVKTYKLYKYIGVAAASVAILISISLFFAKSDNFGGSLSLFAIHHAGSTINSGNAPRKTIFLADGTLITLAKGTTIRLTKNFNSGKRELWLSGEAFFDVKHDKAHPFTVHTKFNDIRVLGTTFNVKAYANSSSMETALIRGSVRVESKKYAGYAVTLKPNEKLITRDDQQATQNAGIQKVFHVSAIKNESLAQKPEEIKWVRNRLDIENQPLSAIATKLQKWYGIEILIKDDEVKNYHYSGVFENENVIKTLEALQLSYPFEFTIKDDIITISK